VQRPLLGGANSAGRAFCSEHEEQDAGFVSFLHVDDGPQGRRLYGEAGLLLYLSSQSRQDILIPLHMPSHAIVEVGMEALGRRPFQEEEIAPM